jgi:electron transfer flavoprotein alpha subunit
MSNEKILVLIHTDSEGALPKIAREAVTAGQELATGLGATFTVGVIGAKAAEAASVLAGAGASEILTVSGPEFEASRYASDAAAAEALAREAGATLVLAPGTARFARALPGAAHRLEGRIDTRVAAIAVAEGKVRIQRGFYRQRMVGTLTRSERPWVLVVDAGGFAAWEGEPGSATPREVEVEIPEGARRTTVIGEVEAGSGASTIRPDAPLLFVAGAGWTKKQADGAAHVKEAEGLIRDFLDRTPASLGSSKSLVDQSGGDGEAISFMSHLNQVGQTGSSPRHPKGLATCCHGEEPHVVGWRFVRERRAVNLDPGCGWARGKADVLYVADAFQVMARVNALLAEG